MSRNLKNLECLFLIRRRNHNFKILDPQVTWVQNLKLRFFLDILTYIYRKYHQKLGAGGGTWIFFDPTENHILLNLGIKIFSKYKFSSPGIYPWSTPC